tara:strand:- start:436 stop:585 length:150 start_codon:yes stop_codon:yes gene_type:complete
MFSGFPLKTSRPYGQQILSLFAKKNDGLGKTLKYQVNNSGMIASIPIQK